MIRKWRWKNGKKLAAAGLTLCLLAGLFPAMPLKAAAQGQKSSFDMSASATDGTEEWNKLKINMGNPEGNPEGSGGTPMGNGIFAAKENGGIAEDIFPLNHSTFWSGDPKYKEDLWKGDASCYGGYGNTQETRKEAYRQLKEVLVSAYREGISDQERLNLMKQVDGLSKKIWNASSTSQASFLSMGRMKLSFPDLTSGTSGYQRILNMDGATSDITFQKGTATYTRQSFISNPDNVMVTRIASSASEAMNMSVTFELPSAMLGKASENKVTVDADRNEVVMNGRAPYDMRVTNGVYGTWDAGRGTLFEARVKVLLPKNDGTVRADGNSLKVTGAGEIVLIYTCETSFKDANTDPSNSGVDYAGVVRQTLDAASQKSYDELLERHQQDFRPLYRRMWIDLEGDPIVKTSGGQSTPFDYARYYQYGRYFSLCSERENSRVPANLLGIWSSTWSPPNNGAFFLNENVEKMQAIKGAGNLSDTADGLYKLLTSVSNASNGGKTAEQTYGAEPGSWMAAHSTDIWAQTGMWGDDPQYSSWIADGIWLMDTLYDKYDYTQDTELLKKYYPIMEGAARFALSTLTSVEGVYGELKDYLVIAPSGSPEHWFSFSGGRASFDISTACDVGVYQNLFRMMQNGAKVLQEEGVSYDTALLERVKQASEKMVPLEMYIDQDTGRLKEFYNEYSIGDPNHRHASHLLALFLNHSTFNEADTPEVYYALQKEADRLFSVGAGRHPDKMVMGVRAGLTDLSYARSDPSISSALLYGPLANYVGETILDSRFGEINLMEYIPSQWKNGAIKGMRARGGYQLSFRWQDGELTDCIIDSPTGETPRVLYKGEGVKLSTDSRFQVNRAALTLEKLQKEAQEKLEGKYTNTSKEALRAALNSGEAAEISEALLAMEPVNRPEKSQVKVTAENNKNVLTAAGETVQLTAVSASENAKYRWSLETLQEGQDIKYTASIDANGMVTAIGGGKVRATAFCLDGSGSTGSIDLMMELPVSEVVNIDDRDGRIQYVKGNWAEWNEAKHMNGTITHSSAAGNAVSLTFTGTGIEFISTQGGHLGGFGVDIDGEVAVPSVNMNTGSQNQYLAFSKYDLIPGEHTITLTSLNINGRTRFDVDAFNVINVKMPDTDRKELRKLYESYQGIENSDGKYSRERWENFQNAMESADTLLQSFTCSQDEINSMKETLKKAYAQLSDKEQTETVDDRDGRISYKGTWTTWNDSKHENGTITYCANSGDNASLTFNGTGIEFVTSAGGHLGGFSVTIDGEEVEPEIRVNGAGQYKFTAYSNHNLKQGEHTILITSKGTAGKRRIDVDAFRVFNRIDKAALREACERYEPLEDDGTYTPLSWEAFRAARETAKARLEDTDITQAQVNEALDVLEQAYEGLKKKGDPAELIGLIAECDGLEEAAFTAESWAQFAPVLEDVRKILDDGNADQSAINQQYNRLLEARLALDEIPASADKKELEELIARAEAVDRTNLRPGKLEDLDLALAEAGRIYDKSDATAAEVAKAADDLLQAIVNLKEIVDRTDVGELAGILAGLKAEAYTPESYGTLSDALAQAETLNDDSEAAQIQEAYRALQEAYGQLVRVPAPADVSSLTNAMKKTEFVLAHEDQFMPSTIKGLKEALEAAQAISEQQGATQDQIDEAVRTLTGANARVRVREDKEVLLRALQKAMLYRSAHYTPESFAVLEAACAQGELIAENGDAGKEQIAGAAADIEKALGGLISVKSESQEPPTQQPTQPDNEALAERKDSTEPDSSTGETSGQNTAKRQDTQETGQNERTEPDPGKGKVTGNTEESLTTAKNSSEKTSVAMKDTGTTGQASTDASADQAADQTTADQASSGQISAAQTSVENTGFLLVAAAAVMTIVLGGAVLWKNKRAKGNQE
ncbi:glycosyl hydrolase family 95 catalytic domain-containing protein [Diplocloster hominis]|uniref:glycosyl hydrolase family 95 catalytic domain-containing protein n=1 Tax=Diplocloster hominis TaxID=3079010 RepID=UPI0031BBA821